MSVVDNKSELQPRMIVSGDAPEEVAKRIAAFSESIDADPAKYLAAARQVCLAAGVTEGLPPSDSTDQGVSPTVLRDIEIYLGGRDDRHVSLDPETDKLLVADGVFKGLSAAFQHSQRSEPFHPAGSKSRIGMRPRNSSDEREAKQLALRVYGLLFFISRVAAANGASEADGERVA